MHHVRFLILKSAPDSQLVPSCIIDILHVNPVGINNIFGSLDRQGPLLKAFIRRSLSGKHLIDGAP